MARGRQDKDVVMEGVGGLNGFLGNLGSLLEKLGDLAEQGGELHREGAIGGSDPKDKIRGVYGVNIKVGIGDQGGVKVEPFGNVRQDKETGQAVVQEVREPMVDVFEEPDRVLVVAEMPGVGEDAVEVDLTDDILTISASKGEKKYRKEVLLPQSFTPAQMTHLCRNGVLEVTLARGAGKKASK
ncbi:MAG: Hsp20/alpha crystallin family protein [Planctomycetota bacterium]|nr:Hsp20/alpha crystallin family protein [Planctomycetota bacterium]